MTALLESTSSQVVSPVNLSAMRASEAARQTTAISGRKCAESLASSDPLGCLLRMLMDSSVWLSPTGNLSWKTKQQFAKKRKWSSKQSGKTLKRLGIDPSQSLFQLAVSVPHTGDTGSSFWASPQARDYRSGDEPESQRSTRKRELGWSQNLNDQVKLWSTPRANDAEKRGMISADPRHGLPGAVLWPTPTNSTATMADLIQAKFSGNNPGRPSYEDAKLWPTPAAQDAKNATLPPSQANRDTIPGAVLRSGLTGQLNPEWVEALMNFPIGWTDGE